MKLPTREQLWKWLDGNHRTHKQTMEYLKKRYGWDEAEADEKIYDAERGYAMQ